MSFSRQPVKKQLLPFQQENVASNQQSVPLKYLAGMRVVAVSWMTPAMNEVVVQTKNGGKKG